MNALYKYMNWPRIEAVVYGEEAAPREVLGPRVTEDGILVQCFFPGAVKVQVEAGRGKRVFEMEQQDEAGYFAVLLPFKRIPDYTYLVWEQEEEEARSIRDPYQFPCQISEMDEKRFLAGIHYEIYEKLGAHPMELCGVKGTYFAVWAPNAKRVSVVGDFNRWDGRRCPMERLSASGIFEIFVPGVEAGALYKYEIKAKGGLTYLKADPYANDAELPPAGASKVCDLEGYEWKDEVWCKGKAAGRPGTPLSIWELDLEAWAVDREGANYRSLAKEGAEYAASMGYTHVELLPVMEHKEDAYATSQYYTPTGRFGSCEDFMAFVDTFHQAGVGVIMDWTPVHFPADDEGLAAFDGTCLYENEDARMKYHPFWGTMLFHLDSPLVRNFLIGNAFFWMRKYHIDGLRMDDVDAMLYLDYGRIGRDWTPNLYGSHENLAAIEFLKHINSVLRKENPEFLLIAQEDGLWPQLTGEVDENHLGFDYKWNRGWTKDFLEYLGEDFPGRAGRHDQLSLSMVYAYFEAYVLTLGKRDVGSYEAFLERLPGTKEQKEAGLRAALAYQICHPGAKLQVDFSKAEEGLQTCLKDLLHLYKAYPALYELDGESQGFQWVQLMKYQENILTFLRKTEKKEDTLLVVLNFSGNNYEDYGIGVPYAGKYKEIFNSDGAIYGGTGFVNPRVKMSRKQECDEREDSIRVKIPALSCSIYAYSQATEKLSNNKRAREKAAKKTSRAKSLKQTLVQKIEAEKKRAEERAGERKSWSK